MPRARTYSSLPAYSLRLTPTLCHRLLEASARTRLLCHAPTSLCPAPAPPRQPDYWEDEEVYDDPSAAKHHRRRLNQAKEQWEAQGTKKVINSELWHAYAGPLVCVPQRGSLFYYFPQGHSEQVAATTKKTPNSCIPNYPSLPSQLLCQVHNITMHADKDTDEVYAQMTLQPVNSIRRFCEFQETDVFPIQSLGSYAKSKHPAEYFCKNLTASDTSTHGGFSVPRRAAEKLFPQLPLIPPLNPLYLSRARAADDHPLHTPAVATFSAPAPPLMDPRRVLLVGPAVGVETLSKSRLERCPLSLGAGGALSSNPLLGWPTPPAASRDSDDQPLLDLKLAFLALEPPAHVLTLDR
ncbi:hypothetical protein ZWY2020_032012 [Hordeum vulgare]|nr:hypothetical protein ZWY2020_032012 [Hordeum vulgare]